MVILYGTMYTDSNAPTIAESVKIFFDRQDARFMRKATGKKTAYPKITKNLSAKTVLCGEIVLCRRRVTEEKNDKTSVKYGVFSLSNSSTTQKNALNVWFHERCTQTATSKPHGH